MKTYKLSKTILCLLLLLVACRDDRNDVYPVYDPNFKEEPRIHSIGQNSLLVFEKDKDLIIPITGAYFGDETLIWSISLTGVASLVEGVDYEIVHPDGKTLNNSSGKEVVRHNVFGQNKSNIINIVLKKEYTNRLKTGDSLNVEVAISDGREHLAINRISDCQLISVDKLSSLTDELNKESSDFKSVYRDVSALLMNFNKVHNYVTKLKNSQDTINQFKTFKSNMAAIRHFLSKRIEIPTNLNVDNNVESKINVITINGVDFDEILTWSQLERRLQTIYQHQESAVSKRRARTIRSKLLSSAYRKFVFYSIEDYRDHIISGSVPINNIAAYPLPQEETIMLFGDYVAELYFVVRLSVYNKTEEDILISTGMIKASGRAMVGLTSVEQNDNENDDSLPNFTVPVEVVPQSREHVYTIVAEGKQHLTREIIFRTLEFAGALGSAYFAGFSRSTDAIKHMSLLPGVVIPQAKRLFPDPVKAQLSNIVNFTMPDFVKVPRNGALEHKYLFFSKGDLQAVVSDIKYAKHDLDAGKGEGPRVVYMAFDSMQIPFENLNNPSSFKNRRSLAVEKEAEAKNKEVASSQVALVLKNAQAQLDLVDDVLNNWGPTNTPEAFKQWGLIYKNWQSVFNVARQTKTNPERIASGLTEYDNNKQIIDDTVAQWFYVLSQFDSSIVRLRFKNNESYKGLKSKVTELNKLTASLNVGQTPTNYKNLLSETEKLSALLSATLSLYKEVARDITQLNLATALPELHGAETDTLVTRLHNLRQPLILYDKLKKKADSFSAIKVPAEAK